MKGSKEIRLEIATWFIRILVGGVFVVSGFVKAIDPWGTLYKVDDYLAAMAMEIWPNLELVGVFSLCALEFSLGIFLLFGCFRRSAALLTGIVMGFMLPLTVWIALSNPVADCGCFGDAFILSNWATFWKNVLLSIGAIWLIIYNKRCSWLITPALQWLAFVVTALFIVGIETYGYIAQPMIDFRPYPNGEVLVDVNQSFSDEPRFIFVYEKDGVTHEFGEDDLLPDEEDGWKFVDRKEIQSSSQITLHPGMSAKEKNIRIWSKDGEEDETEEALRSEGKELIVMIPELLKVSPATTWKLNSLYEWSVKNDVKMIAVVSGTSAQIANWEDLSMASYPIYTADDTQIKEVVRGNPGIVYLVNGVVEWKNSLTAINVDDFMSPGISNDAVNFGTDNIRLLRNISYLYVTLMAVLIILSFLPKIKDYYLAKPKKEMSDKNE